MNVLITADLPPIAREIVEKGGHDVVAPDPRSIRTESALIKAASSCEAIIATVNDQISASLLKSLPRLRVVGNYAVGYNNVDIAAAAEQGIWVTNTPGILTDATADLTMGLILAVTRRMNEGESLVRTGQWKGFEPQMLLGMTLRGKRLGIIGLGRIGQAVAMRAQAFGMEVVYHSRSRRLEIEKQSGAPYMKLADLLRTSHVVSLHAPLTSETEHIINRETLARMRPGSYLVNSSRGPLVDEKALADALASGHLRGAALDVFEREPEVEPRLLAMKNVVLLPHLGSATAEARRDMARIVATDVCRALEGKRPKHVVVAPSAGRRKA